MSRTSPRSNVSSKYPLLFFLALALVNSMVGDPNVVVAIGSSTQVVLGGGEARTHPKTDVDYVSKRSVPKGPDPIHNRRASNSRQPPGKALR